jgi:hypothetical protein
LVSNPTSRTNDQLIDPTVEFKYGQSNAPYNIHIKAVSDMGSTAIKSFPIKFELCSDIPYPISNKRIVLPDLTETDAIVIKELTDFFIISYFHVSCTGTFYSISYNTTEFPGIYPIVIDSGTKLKTDSYTIGTFIIKIRLLLTQSLIPTIQEISQKV